MLKVFFKIFQNRKTESLLNPGTVPFARNDFDSTENNLRICCKQFHKILEIRILFKRFSSSKNFRKFGKNFMTVDIELRRILLVFLFCDKDKCRFRNIVLMFPSRYSRTEFFLHRFFHFIEEEEKV